MKAMILAAGLGTRMRPLTDNTPKPLLLCAGKSLIVYHIEALVAAGVTDIVINHAYLGEQIVAALGDGSFYGARITYSPEGEPMDTGAGIANALPLLGEDPFILTNGDIWTDFDYRELVDKQIGLAHLVMVDNPAHNPQGDFVLSDDQHLLTDSNNGKGVGLTYSGISLLDPQLFADSPRTPFPLKQPLVEAMQQKQVTGQHFDGRWIDVGTPERLRQLEQQILASE